MTLVSDLRSQLLVLLTKMRAFSFIALEDQFLDLIKKSLFWFLFS